MDSLAFWGVRVARLSLHHRALGVTESMAWQPSAARRSCRRAIRDPFKGPEACRAVAAICMGWRSPACHGAQPSHKLDRVVADLEQKLASYLDIDRYLRYTVAVPAPSTVNTTPVTPRSSSPGYMSFGSRASRVMRLQPSAFDCPLSARAGSSSGAGSSAAPLSGVGSTGALGGGRASSRVPP